VSSALPAYIQSNFLNQFISLNTLGIFMITANALTILSILFFPKLIKNLSNSLVTKLVMVMYAVSLVLMALTTRPVSAFISVTLFTISTNLLFINMDVLIETFSKNASTGATRTIYFTFINLGWMLSPSLSSQLIKLDGYPLTFLVAALLILPVILIFIYQKRNLKKTVRYSQEKISTVIKRTWKNKNLRGVFFIALLLQIFFNTAVVYLPIYLHQNLGIGWGELGLMFSIMLIPFLIFEIPAGIIADKYIGEQEILFLGFFILICSLFLFFYIKVPTFWIWTAVLFLSRTGAALIEAMRETYFFKIVDAKDIGYINIFRISTPLGYVIGSLLAILVISFASLNYLFLIIGFISILGFASTALIKDTK
jgi:MFS family permease